jgi:hypothetical protein
MNMKMKTEKELVKEVIDLLTEMRKRSGDELSNLLANPWTKPGRKFKGRPFSDRLVQDEYDQAIASLMAAHSMFKRATNSLIALGRDMVGERTNRPDSYQKHIETSCVASRIGREEFDKYDSHRETSDLLKSDEDEN